MTGGQNGVQICLQKQLALLDGVAVLAVDGEGLAVQTDRLQTHVDQDLNAGVGLQAHGVTGDEHGLHSAVDGGVDLAVGGDDGDAVAQQALGEGGIGDVGDGNGLAVHGSVDLIAVKNGSLLGLGEQIAEKTHGNDFLSVYPN